MIGLIALLLAGDAASPLSEQSAKADLLNLGVTSFHESAQVLGSLTPGQPDTGIDMFGHIHEHPGQAIAYARMIGVTPAWSQAE